MLQSDRGLTYTGDIPSGSKVVEGQWWGRDYSGPPLVSFEKKLADGLGLKLGDSVTMNVLGRNVTAKIANMRTVDWQNLGINFVLVFSPNVFRGAPHTHIATLTEPTVERGERCTDHQGGRRRLPQRHQCAGAGGAGDGRHRRHQPGAGDPRLQRHYPVRRHAGAGRSAGRRPPAPGL